MILYFRQPDILKTVKTVVFDIDGVLLDVSDSFRKAIIYSVDYYFRIKFRFKGKVHLTSNSVIDLFKQSGGFNNDWELASAILLTYLNEYAKKVGASTFEELKLKEEVFARLLQEINTDREGVEAFKRFFLYREIAGKKLLELYDEELLHTILKLAYAGSKAEKVYGNLKTLPEKFKKKIEGFELYKREKPLLNEKYLFDNLNYAVVTGRNPGETMLAKSFFPELFSKACFVAADDGSSFLKPSPQVLEPLIEKNLLPAVFAGDSRDDLETVKNAKEEFSTDLIYFAAVIRNPEQLSFYLKLNADIITDDINLLLMAASHERGISSG